MNAPRQREFFLPSCAGTQLWVGISGSGPPFVLCDGLGCDGFIWKYLLPDLAQRYTVIRWHYRGHGLSEPAPSDRGYGPVPFAEDLIRILEECAREPALLAGHSMGVQVLLEAWWLLEDRGETQRIAGLVPICGAPGRPLDTFKGTHLGRTALPFVLQALERYPKWIRSQWQRWVPSRLTHVIAEKTEINARLMPIDDLAPYLQRLSTMDPARFFQTLAAAADHDRSGELHLCHLPTLVVAAERDSFTPMERSLEMVRAMPNAQFFVLPQATHTGPLEWPELLWLRLRKFLREAGLVPEGPPLEPPPATLAAPPGLQTRDDMDKPQMPGPVSFSSRKLRRAEIECDVTVDSASNFYTGIAQNISEGGIYVKGSTELEPGTVIGLRFTLDDEGPPIEMQGEIRWHDSEESNEETVMKGFGVRFLQPRAPDITRIRGFIARRSPMMNPDE